MYAMQRDMNTNLQAVVEKVFVGQGQGAGSLLSAEVHNRLHDNQHDVVVSVAFGREEDDRVDITPLTSWSTS